MFDDLRKRWNRYWDQLGTTPIDEYSGIQSDGRDGYKYIEGDHIMRIQAELQVPKREWYVIVYTSTINKWQPPYENEIISEEHKKEILERMCDYLRRKKIKFEVK